MQAYAREIVRFLLEAGAQGIVIACNAASAVAREVVWAEAQGKPVWEAISATLQQFEAQPPEFPLGVIGTYTTIRSGIYGAAIRERWPEAPIAQLPTPLLVPLIEEGFADHPATQLILQTYLSSPALRGIRGLLLACTHYPLLREAIEAYYQGRSETCRLYHSAEMLARTVVSELWRLPALPASAGSDIFWVSDYTERFAELAALFWGEALPLQKALTFVGS